MIIYLDAFRFIGNHQDLTLVRMEFHFIYEFPGLEGIEVFLQDGRVLFSSNSSIEEAIITEESDVGVFGEVTVNIVYIGQEQKGAKDCSLGDAGEDWGWGRRGAVIQDSSGAVGLEGADP